MEIAIPFSRHLSFCSPGDAASNTFCLRVAPLYGEAMKTSLLEELPVERVVLCARGVENWRILM